MNKCKHSFTSSFPARIRIHHHHVDKSKFQQDALREIKYNHISKLNNSRMEQQQQQRRTTTTTTTLE